MDVEVCLVDFNSIEFHKFLLIKLISVSEFSESLREMGDCLLEKTALNDEEETGKLNLSQAHECLPLKRIEDCIQDECGI